jgi:hypothetical protein
MTKVERKSNQSVVIEPLSTPKAPNLAPFALIPQIKRLQIKSLCEQRLFIF